MNKKEINENRTTGIIKTIIVLLLTGIATAIGKGAIKDANRINELKNNNQK